VARVPHISLFDELDARPLLAAHAAARALDDRITLTAYFVRAAVLAIEAFPILNASLDGARDELVFHGAVNMASRREATTPRGPRRARREHPRRDDASGARSCG